MQFRSININIIIDVDLHVVSTVLSIIVRYLFNKMKLYTHQFCTGYNGHVDLQCTCSYSI